MDYRELGKTGVHIPVLGLGTWKLGSDEEAGMEALHEGFRLGMKLVDTAEMYHTEELVGRAIADEKGIFVATKVSPDHFSYENVIRSCNESLRKLNVKQIDLYQLHWPNSRIPISETMRAMEELVRQGKIKYIGVSNFSVKEVEEAQAALKRNEIVSNQVEYSILVRQVEKELYDYCRKQAITIIAYSPLARGRMLAAGHKELYELLSDIGKGYGKTPTQVALSWLISKENVIAIPKAVRMEHVVENAGAAFKLREADQEKIARFLKVQPVARRLNSLTKYTASLWSPIIRFKERFRH